MLRPGRETCLTESDCKVDLQKSIATQIRQLLPYISNNKEQVDGCFGELSSTKRLFVRDKIARFTPTRNKAQALD